jgi:hypothetical protein
VIRWLAAVGWALALLYVADSVHADGWTSEDTIAAIDQSAADYGVSTGYLRAVVWCESRYQPYALGRRGERGPVQLLPGGSEEQRFFAAGYRDVWSPWSAVPFLASELALGRGFAWSCA